MRGLRCPLQGLAAFLIFGALAGSVAAAAPGKIDFNFQVRPILADRCFPCHGPDEKKRKARLRLDTPAGARRVIVSGHPEKSELIRRITADEAERMPPRTSNLTLTAEEIDAVASGGQLNYTPPGG